MRKKLRSINWGKVKDQSKRVVFGNPNEERQTSKTRTIFIVVVVLYILSMLLTYVF